MRGWRICLLLSLWLALITSERLTRDNYKLFLGSELADLDEGAQAMFERCLERTYIDSKDIAQLVFHPSGHFVFRDEIEGLDLHKTDAKRTLTQLPDNTQTRADGMLRKRWSSDSDWSWIGLPLLHSRKGATKVIYLVRHQPLHFLCHDMLIVCPCFQDFDGHISPPGHPGWGYFDALAYSLDEDYSLFNDQEQLEIYITWRRVLEDYMPFNVIRRLCTIPC